MPPLQTTRLKDRPERPNEASAESRVLAAASFGERAPCPHESDPTVREKTEDLDQIGPHIGFLKDLGGVTDSYRAVQSRSEAEKRLEHIERREDLRFEFRGRATNLPKDATAIDMSAVLADQRRSGPITDFKAFLDRAGIEPGETSYMRFPDGSFSAIRRRVLDNTTAADEVVWVETFSAVGHLYSLEFIDRGALLLGPICHDIQGFFEPATRIAVMPMINKRNGRSFSEWRTESLLMLQTAVHELEQGRGGGEYEARAAADAYLCRNGVMQAPEDPERRLESISCGWYSSYEYSSAVGAAMRDLKTPNLVVPRRLANPDIESIPVPIVASASIGSFESLDALQGGCGAELLTYGLTQGVIDHWYGRRWVVRQEGLSPQLHWWLGEPLHDRLMQETLQADNFNLRILVAEALSHRVAHECVELAKVLNKEGGTSDAMRALGDDIATHFEPGDVHLAVRDYVSYHGGAAMISCGKDTMWINSLPEGIAIRRADSVSIYFARPLHRGGALRVPMGKECCYKKIADRVRAFSRDTDLIETMYEHRSEKVLWQSVAVPQIGRGARYLFPASNAAMRPTKSRKP